MTLLSWLIIFIWFVGYVISFWMLKKMNACDGNLFEIGVCSGASWLLLASYAVWYFVYGRKRK